jgi:hypothetical protein
VDWRQTRMQQAAHRITAELLRLSLLVAALAHDLLMAEPSGSGCQPAAIHYFCTAGESGAPHPGRQLSPDPYAAGELSDASLAS